MLQVQDFEVWRPLVEYAWPYVVDGRAFNGEVRIKGGHMISGAMLPQPPMAPGRAMQVEDYAEQDAPFEVIRHALRADGVPAVEFNVEIDAAGAVTVRVVVASGRRSGPLGEVDLVEGALPEPYRRRPVQPAPEHPRGPVDMAELDRILREVWPNEVGMADAEIAAVGARLGVVVPPEARVLFRVTRGRNQVDIRNIVWDVPVPFDVWALDDPRREVRRPRYPAWWRLARTAGNTAPDSEVQALSQPAEWFVLGTVDWYHIAIDMVPGPAGKVGQVIGWSDENRDDLPFGAQVLADSLLDFVRHNRRERVRRKAWTEELPEFGEVTTVNERLVEDVVSPALEVLEVVRNRDNQVSIAPAVGLPRLRTLYAMPGAIADSLEIGKLDRLEYLETGVDEWRALLDAGTVSRSLLACKVDPGFGNTADVHQVAELTDRVRDLWGLQSAERTVTVRGQLRSPPTRP